MERSRFLTPTDAYMKLWTPLVGDRAATVIWRSSRATVAYLAGAFVFAIACGFGFEKSVPLGLVLLSGGVASYSLMIRERIKIATAFSDYFATPIRLLDLPKLTPTAVTRACERHGWSRPDAPHPSDPAT